MIILIITIIIIAVIRNIAIYDIVIIANNIVTS